MKYKKKFITLIELMVAMALTSLLLMLLLHFYRDMEWWNQDINKSQVKAFQIFYVQNRLSDILSHAVSPRTEEKDFFFYTSQDVNGLLKPNNPSLVFTYHFGPNRDPLFANHVLGRLYVDVQDNLRLATLPSPKFWPSLTSLKMKNEILMEGIESLAFNFYIPPQKDRSLVGNKAPQGSSNKDNYSLADIQPADSWEHSEWKSEYNQLPAMIKIILKAKERKEPITWVYPFPFSDFTIIYNK